MYTGLLSECKPCSSDRIKDILFKGWGDCLQNLNDLWTCSVFFFLPGGVIQPVICSLVALVLCPLTALLLALLALLRKGLRQLWDSGAILLCFLCADAIIFMFFFVIISASLIGD